MLMSPNIHPSDKSMKRMVQSLESLRTTTMYPNQGRELSATGLNARADDANSYRTTLHWDEVVRHSVFRLCRIRGYQSHRPPHQLIEAYLVVVVPRNILKMGRAWPSTVVERR